MNKVEQILDRAESLLRDEGWIQGSEYDGKSYCLIGSINYASLYLGYGYRGDDQLSEDDAPSPLCAQVYKVVGQALQNRGYDGDIVMFNDTENRLVDEVLEILKLAKELAAEVDA